MGGGTADEVALIDIIAYLEAAVVIDPGSPVHQMYGYRIFDADTAGTVVINRFVDTSAMPAIL